MICQEFLNQAGTSPDRAAGGINTFRQHFGGNVHAPFAEKFIDDRIECFDVVGDRFGYRKSCARVIGHKGAGAGRNSLRFESGELLRDSFSQRLFV